MYTFLVFIVGLLFGAGLTISNMINPNKVLNFLNVTGHWDPTLLIVMVVALTTTFLGYQFILKRNKPVFDSGFHVPKKRRIDKNLVFGSIIFGVGWGLAGYCPGPSISALALFNMDAVYCVIGMVVGSLAYNQWRAFEQP